MFQNAARIVRALFEVALRKGWPVMAGRLLLFSKIIEKWLWGFVFQNAARIVRALFEVALRKGWPVMAGRLLLFSKIIKKRLWGFVFQNAARIVRALFEVALRKGWPVMAGRLLLFSKIIEKRLWGFEHPLRQFAPFLSAEVLNKLEARDLTIARIHDMHASEIGQLHVFNIECS